MDIRPVTLEDAPGLHALTRRWEVFWDAPLVTPLHEIEEELTAPFMDLDRHTRAYFEGDRMVAYGRIWYRPGGGIQERAYIQGFVDPEYRGRGIGRELMAWQVDRGTEILRSVEADVPRFLRADEWEWVEENHRMYRRFGLEVVRYFTEMVKKLDDEMVSVDPIQGVDIVPYDRSMDRSVLDALNSSFADHWGSTPTDMEAFQHRLDGAGTRLDLSFLALHGEEVVGVCLNAHFPEDEELLGRRDGWVESLGVVQQWRGRGIAKALLNTSFNAFRGAGLTHSMLGVDTENPNKALDLYRGLGYEPTHRSITSQIEVLR